MWGAKTYNELFTIQSADVVSGTSYQAHTATVSNRGWVITYGGNNNSVGTNSNKRGNCKLSSYTKYAVSPVTSSQTASAFVSTTSISDVSKISYTYTSNNKGSNSTNVYLIYSSNGTSFSQMSLTSGTQGATISSGTAYEFTKCSGYFGLLFEATNNSGDWRIDAVNITFYEEEGSSCSAKPTVGANLTSVNATTNSITATIPISAIGGCNITENGLVYSSSVATPTIGAANCTKVTTTACGSTAANKTVTITGLTCGQSYYVRGYAENEAGIQYTDVLTQSTSDCPKYTVTYNAGTGSCETVRQKQILQVRVIYSRVLINRQAI